MYNCKSNATFSQYINIHDFLDSLYFAMNERNMLDFIVPKAKKILSDRPHTYRVLRWRRYTSFN